VQTIDEDAARLRAFVEDAARNGVERLPPEPKLSLLLGVSRGRLRTLLKRAEEEGQIWRHVGKGTFLGQRDMATGLAPIPVSMDDIMDARMVLEPQLAAQAAIHATRDDVAALEACHGEMLAGPSMTEWKRLDARLHRTLAEATHNDLLLMLYDTLRAHGRALLDARIERVLNAELAPRESTHGEHGAMIDAIRQHDPELAENSMRAHLVSVRAKLFGLR
jgi:DNA-binding FadR family transcriptional regulator